MSCALLSSSQSLRRRRLAFTAVSAVIFFFLVIEIYKADASMWTAKRSSTSLSVTHRKLLNHAMGNEEGNGNTTVVEEPNRIWSERCSKSDIMISQGATEPLPNGIPTYTVEIMNVGVSGCDISGIHLSCGWFSSARLVNPRVFKRVRFDDCLVNQGKPLANGRTLSFHYANTFPYPLTVSSVTC